MLKANGLSVSLVTAADFKMKEEIIKLKKNPSQFSIKQPILDNQTQYSTNAKKKLDIHMDYLRQEYTERTYKALKELKTSHYLIRPLSIRLKIKVFIIYNNNYYFNYLSH